MLQPNIQAGHIDENTMSAPRQLFRVQGIAPLTYKCYAKEERAIKQAAQGLGAPVTDLVANEKDPNGFWATRGHRPK